MSRVTTGKKADFNTYQGQGATHIAHGQPAQEVLARELNEISFLFSVFQI